MVAYHSRIFAVIFIVVASFMSQAMTTYMAILWAKVTSTSTIYTALILLVVAMTSTCTFTSATIFHPSPKHMATTISSVINKVSIVWFKNVVALEHAVLLRDSSRVSSSLVFSGESNPNEVEMEFLIQL